MTARRLLAGLVAAAGAAGVVTVAAVSPPPPAAASAAPAEGDPAYLAAARAAGVQATDGSLLVTAVGVCRLLAVAGGRDEAVVFVEERHAVDAPVAVVVVDEAVRARCPETGQVGPR